MAPPVLVAAEGDGQAPRKMRLGAWMLPAHEAAGARQGACAARRFDPFGRTEERRLERALIAEYEARVDELLPTLSADNQTLAAAIANVPLTIRGYGHVKLANLAIARARESELLHRFDPERYPRPTGPAVAGQFRGIPVTSA